MGAHNEEQPRTLGNIIRQRRVELGMTQEDLAERIGESVRQSDISRMERGYVSLPRRERLEALAAALDVTPGYLLMHSGWVFEGETAGIDGSSADRQSAGRANGSGDEPDGRHNGGRISGAAAADGASGHPSHPPQMSRANLDVIEANRELTRAIQALTVEYQEGQGNGAGNGSPTANGHASVEDLGALNAELRTIIEDLSTRNDDLEARSIELQAAALFAENARFQLHAVMNAVGDLVVVVDEDQAIVLQSQSFADLVGTDARALQFRDAQGTPLEGSDSPLARVARGESFAGIVQVATPSGGVQSFQAVGRPSGLISGHRLGVLTLRGSGESSEPPG